MTATYFIFSRKKLFESEFSERKREIRGQIPLPLPNVYTIYCKSLHRKLFGRNIIKLGFPEFFTFEYGKHDFPHVSPTCMTQQQQTQ